MPPFPPSGSKHDTVIMQTPPSTLPGFTWGPFTCDTASDVGSDAIPPSYRQDFSPMIAKPGIIAADAYISYGPGAISENANSEDEEKELCSMWNRALVQNWMESVDDKTDELKTLDIFLEQQTKRIEAAYQESITTVIRAHHLTDEMLALAFPVQEVMASKNKFNRKRDTRVKPFRDQAGRVLLDVDMVVELKELEDVYHAEVHAWTRKMLC